MDEDRIGIGSGQDLHIVGIEVGQNRDRIWKDLDQNKIGRGSREGQDQTEQDLEQVKICIGSVWDLNRNKIGSE
jgi:hypothetical protein